MTTAVAMESVTFTYPGSERPALKEVTLDVQKGSFVLVSGDTGSGKSTLIRAMNGLVPHFTGGSFSGVVTIAGRNTIDNPPRALADIAAFVPQDPAASFVVDRVEDELAYAMENLAVEPEKMRRRVEEVLDLLDIEALRDRSVRSLSGGERQRVAIAAALTPGAETLLLDEPTSQLDPQGAEDVLNALKRLVHDHGFTVVLAEHRLERVAGFADAAIGCIDGVAFAGTVTDVLGRLGGGPPVARIGRSLGWDPLPLDVRDARRLASSITLPPAPETIVRGSGPPSLVVRNMSAAYDDRIALRDVDLSFSGGETVSLLGRNGAGKTTFLRALAGLHRPTGGRVTYEGDAPRPGRTVALSPQSPEDILFSDTVAHEVGATLKSSVSSREAVAYLGDLGIVELADRHPRDLSAGQRLLVALAAVAATEAPVLLLDEPTRGLDPSTKEMLGRLLATWSDEGRIVIFATHDVELAAELASRVVVLAKGEVISDGMPGDVLSDSQVFAPQMTRVFGKGWLTPRQVAVALGVA